MTPGPEPSSADTALTPERYRRVQEVVDQAWQLRFAQRQPFVEAAFGTDARLVSEALGLLQARQDLDGADEGLGAGTRIGNYRVERLIGRGGMGEVYLAKRADHFQRDVAIKVIRTDVDHSEITARFKLELQILASLQHPNIARLDDAGALEDSRPYILMEYVDGIPITDYADRLRLSVRDRLKLFQSVCAAVAHAHRHSIVHRDIKPSNILVTPTGVPKLLDFGIAKVLTPGGQDALRLTATDLTPGTPLYASPEQLSGQPLDERADIYALGVVLSELVAGVLPYVPGQDIDERIRIKPSEAVRQALEQSSGASAREGASVIGRASARATTPQGLVKQLRGDLDAIVMRAVQDQPTARYATASALSDDIQRYLNGEAVDARPNSVAYRTTTFVRRRPLILGLILAALVVVWLGMNAGLLTNLSDGSNVNRNGGLVTTISTATPTPTVTATPTSTPAPTPTASPTPRMVTVEADASYDFDVFDGRSVRSTRKQHHRFLAADGERLWIRAPEYFLNDERRVRAGTSIPVPELAMVYFVGADEDCRVKRPSGDFFLPRREPVAVGKRTFSLNCPPGRRVPTPVTIDISLGVQLRVRFQ